MKTLGLIGGMSWESTTLYYQFLNRMARDRLGGQHSASLVMVSVDFAPIARMQAAGLWDEATGEMVEAARRLERAGAEAIVICANTMHRMADDVAASVAVPLIHVAEATAAAIRASGVKRPLLLATRFTMEQPFYRDRLRRHGVEALIPSEPDRACTRSFSTSWCRAASSWRPRTRWWRWSRAPCAVRTWTASSSAAPSSACW